MGINDLKALIPDYAKDIRLNLSSLATEDALNSTQLWGTWVASAYATGNVQLIQHVMAEASEHLNDAEMDAAKAAAAVMGMNNVKS